MKQLLIATGNKGKLREIKAILSDVPFQYLSLGDVEDAEEAEETGKTFEENAILKARTIGEKTGMLTIADDSGLEIDVLGGKPGIYSARYAEGSDEDRFKKVLDELKIIPQGKRNARFISVVALYNPITREVKTFTGECRGYITDEPQGTNGFGYDPVFFSPELGKTFGEASLEEKLSVDHRGRAFQKAKKLLLTSLRGGTTKQAL